MAGLPRFITRVCRVAPHEINVKVIQSTRPLLQCPGGPGGAFLISGGGHAACGATAGLSHPAYEPSYNIKL